MKKIYVLYCAALILFLIPVVLFVRDFVPGKQGKAPRSSLVRLKEKKTEGPAVSRKNEVVLAIEKALPAVVNIGTERIVPLKYSSLLESDPIQRIFEDFLRTRENTRSFSLGSGFLVDPSGIVVTNAHVVDRASRIHVTLNGGRTCEGTVIAYDSAGDIALLQLKDPPENLPCSRLDQSGMLYLGETVIAVGNPFGLDSSISVGTLSGTQRRFTYGGKVLFSDILQMDAIVYPGNSGGPLININGEVIGMNMSLYENAPGIGFAIPVSRVLSCLLRWMIPERFCGLVLGVIPGIRQKENGVPALYVQKIIPGTPAALSGLSEGAMIRTVNGKIPGSLLDLSRTMIQLRKGKSLVFGTDKGIYKITPREFLPQDSFPFAAIRLGLILSPLTPEIAETLGCPVDSGLIVSGIRKNTPARIRRGDLLVMLNGKRINTEKDLAAILKGTHPGMDFSAVFLSPMDQYGNMRAVQYRVNLKLH